MLNLANLLTAGIYYIIVGVVTFFSAFAVYIVIRYGTSRIFALFLGLVYIFFYLTALSGSYATLQGILN